MPVALEHTTKAMWITCESRTLRASIAALMWWWRRRQRRWHGYLRCSSWKEKYDATFNLHFSRWWKCFDGGSVGNNKNMIEKIYSHRRRSHCRLSQIMAYAHTHSVCSFQFFIFNFVLLFAYFFSFHYILLVSSSLVHSRMVYFMASSALIK